MAANSPLAALLGGGGDPPSRSLSQKESLYVRDALSGIVGNGLTDLRHQDVKVNLSYL